MGDLITIQANAISNLAYLLSTNLGLIFMVIGVTGCITLLAKEEIDMSIREEQNII